MYSGDHTHGHDDPWPSNHHRPACHPLHVQFCPHNVPRPHNSDHLPQGSDRYAAITADTKILIFARQSGELRQRGESGSGLPKAKCPLGDEADIRSVSLTVLPALAGSDPTVFLQRAQHVQSPISCRPKSRACFQGADPLRSPARPRQKEPASSHR